jgi:hypothetical protein
MEIIKNNKIVILILLPIIILVMLRLSGINHFKPDAEKWAEVSFSGGNIITIEKADQLTGSKTIINLSEKGSDSFNSDYKIITTTPESILDSEILKKIRKEEGSILIYSSDLSVSSGIWMVLRQMGINNISVVTDDPANEAIKYKFRPDTIVRPEL